VQGNKDKTIKKNGGKKVRINKISGKFFWTFILGMVLMAYNVTPAVAADNEGGGTFGQEVLVEDSSLDKQELHYDAKFFGKNGSIIQEDETFDKSQVSFDKKEVKTIIDEMGQWQSEDYEILLGPVNIIDSVTLGDLPKNTELTALTNILLADGTSLEAGSELYIGDVIQQGFILNNGEKVVGLECSKGKMILEPGKGAVVFDIKIDINTDSNFFKGEDLSSSTRGWDNDDWLDLKDVDGNNRQWQFVFGAFIHCLDERVAGTWPMFDSNLEPIGVWLTCGWADPPCWNPEPGETCAGTLILYHDIGMWAIVTMWD